VCSLLLFASPAAPSWADAPRNTKPFTRFKVILQSALTDMVPFDVPFIIWGDVVDGAAEYLTLQVLVPPPGASCTDGKAATLEQEERAELRRWTLSDYTDRNLPVPRDLAAATEQQFEILIKPLAPSRRYCFVFQTEPGRALSASEVTLLGSQLTPVYTQFVRDLDRVQGISELEVERLRQRLIQALLRASPLVGFRPLPGTMFDPQTDAASVSTVFKTAVRSTFEANSVVALGLAAFQATQDPQRAARTAVVNAWRDWSRDATLQATVADPTMPAAQRDELNWAVSLTFDDRWNLLVGLPAGAPLDLMSDVGAAPETTPCPLRPPLGPRCERLIDGRDRLSRIRQTVIARRPAAADLSIRIQSTIDVFGEQIEALSTLQHDANARDDAIQANVNALKGTIATTFTTLITTVGNLETRRTWYLSMDTGFAIAPWFNEVFPYLGVNVYFRPVNTSAPPGPFLSRFAALLGVTFTDNLIVPRETRPLFGESGNLVVGAGLRATNIIRLNGGALVFKGVNPNPLIDRTRIEMTPFFSVSADIDIGGIVTRFGSANAQPLTIGSGSIRP
jgi:hypothetical protein